MGHLLFGEMLFVLRDRNIESRRADDPAFVHGVFVGMVQGDEVVIALDGGKVEASRPSGWRRSPLPAPLEIGHEPGEFFAARGAIEAADGDVDRMDRPAAQHFQQLIAVLLQPQAAVDFVGNFAASSMPLSQPRKSGACSKWMCRAWLSIHSPQ